MYVALPSLWTRIFGKVDILRNIVIHESEMSRLVCLMVGA